MSDLFSKVGIDLGVVVLLLIVLIIVMMIMTVSMSLRLSRLNQKYRSFMKGKDARKDEFCAGNARQRKHRFYPECNPQP